MLSDTEAIVPSSLRRLIFIYSSHSRLTLSTGDSLHMKKQSSGSLIHIQCACLSALLLAA
jgi:hypothetical protein